MCSSVNIQLAILKVVSLNIATKFPLNQQNSRNHNNMTSPRYCRSNKLAQYVCINKSCPHKIAFICSDPHDSCKHDHECCSLVSWNFIVKRVSQLQKAQEKISTSDQLQNAYKSLIGSVKEIENLLNTDQKNSQMHDIIECSYLNGASKTKISQFLSENLNQAPSEDDQHPSARKIQIQLDDTRLRIMDFLHLMRENRRKKEEGGPFSLEEFPNKSEEERQQLAINSRIRGQQSSKINGKQRGSEIRQKGSHISDKKISKIINPQQSKVSGFQLSPERIVMPSKVSGKNTGSGLNGLSPGKSRFGFQLKDKANFQDNSKSLVRHHLSKGPLFSKITNDIETLQSLFSQKFINATLLYRASENDFLVSKFHQKCNNKTHTLTIVLTEFEKVIGGYTPLPWKSGGGDWYEDENCESFLYSLSTGQRYVLQCKEKAIWCSKTYGPSFGHPDLEIADKAIHNSNSCAKFPMSYNNGNYLRNQESTTMFCGSKTGSFRINEWEVYQLEFPG